MFLSTHRFNHSFDIDNHFDSFWNKDFNDVFSSFMRPSNFSLSNEDRLKRKLQSLKTQNDEVLHYIKSYESEVEQLKKTKQQIESQKNEITQQLSSIQQDMQNKIESSTQNKDENGPKSESYVFKRSHYKTNDMEIEEQYDSRNPEKCYKIIKKQGEQPQIIYQQQQKQQILPKNE